MIGKLADWLDHRTGYRKLRDAMLLEHIPGGAKWRYVWGSTLAFVFMIQLITGVLLMTAYSPGDTTAWGSVYFIQYEMDFGWLIRGLHHFGSQTMVVLLGVHMLQVVIAGAHLPPREINWWLGLALMGIVLGLSLTGYLLPWDQKGFFATQVATNILGSLPGIGTFMQKVVVGGPVYGNQTLTHFYALHVGILPPILIVLLVAHIAVFRRHGLTTPPSAQGEGIFWPDQAFRDLIVCLVVFGVMLGLVLYGGHGNKVESPAAVAKAEEPDLYQDWAKAGKKGLGANLDAPADPLTEGYPARPEWYFLFLFQLLKYFEGEHFLIGAVVIPNAVGALLFLLPLFGYGKMRKFGHIVGIVVVLAFLISVASLTVLAMADDSPTPYPLNLGGGSTRAKDLHHKFEKAEREAHRAVQLAAQGIPEEGGRYLLRGDPMTQGPKLVQMNCAVCHKFSATPSRPGFEGFDDYKAKYKGADLADFASEKWIRGLLDNPGDQKYFGLTKLQGMKNWKSGVMERRKEWTKVEVAAQEKELDLIARWLAAQKVPLGSRDKQLQAEGSKAFFKKKSCGSCHTVDKEGGEGGPDLTGYGSDDWLRLMLMAPGHPARYGDKNEMPAFREFEGPGAEIHKQEFMEGPAKGPIMYISAQDRELIIRWLTGDYRVIFGGKVIAGAPK